MTRRKFVQGSFRLFLSLGLMTGLSACGKDPQEVDSGGDSGVSETEKRQTDEDNEAEKLAERKNLQME